MRAIVLALGVLALGACAEVPTLQFVDDGVGDGSTSPTSVGDADAAPVEVDATSPPGDDGGATSEDAADDSDAGCSIPKGPKAGKCCGTIVCIGDHCNAAQTCTECALCVGHAFCCAQGGGDVKCIDDAGVCN